MLLKLLGYAGYPAAFVITIITEYIKEVLWSFLLIVWEGEDAI